MSKQLTHKERVRSVLEGREVDRPVVSAWRHFYDKENTIADLVGSMLGFQRKFDWDFIKINSRASYHVEDWGVRFRYSDDPMVKPVPESFPVAANSDWVKIKPLDWRSGALGEILNAGQDLLAQIGSEVFCLPTIFSPLSIAADLVENEEGFIGMMHDAPDDLHGALESITATFSGYVKEFIQLGMAGIFFATTEWASRDLITEEQYLEFGRPYDLRILEAASGGIFNVMHVCKTNNMLPLFRDYPAQVLSWNPFETGNLSIHQAAQITDKIFLTGIDQNGVLLSGSEDQIRNQIESSFRDSPPGRLMIGPGCAVKVTTPDENLFALCNAVKGWKP
jgi:uroporphyrinogen decarboxylase